MDNKQILEGLEKRYQELYDEYQTIREDLLDFEGTPEYDAYMAYTSDEIRQEMYPEQFEKFKKKANLETRVEALEKEIKIQAGNVYKSMTEKIEKLESKIQTNNEYVEKLKEKIKAIEKEIEDLKESPEFKNGDQEAKLRLEELMDELKAKKTTITKIEKDTKNISKEMEQLKDYMKTLAEQYELEEEQPVAEEQKEAPKKETERESEETPEQSQEEAKDSPAAPEAEEQPKRRVSATRESGYVNPFSVKPDSPTPDVPEELTPEESPAEPTPTPGAKKNISQKEFKKIYKRAKKQNLTREDFETLSVIMSDPANYDKYGITTGVIFNKSKHLLRAMAKTTFTTGQVVKGCRTVLGIEIEKASKENDMVSTKSLLENKGITVLMENPDQKVASMELFKRVVQLDRDSLSEEKQVVYDQAAKHLSDFEALKGVLKTYSGVVQSRSKKSVSTLPPAESPAVTSPSSSDRGIQDELAAQVNNEPVVVETVEPKPREQEDLTV